MVINCKEIAEKIITEAKEKIAELKNSGVYPKLAVVMVGNSDASKIYVRNKTEACKKAGIETEEYIYNEDISQEELIRSIENLNSDPSITGILVQLPLPKHIDETEICKTISPSKDVDVFNPQNFGDFILGDKSLIPCTAYGIIKILEYKKISLSGKNCVVIGRSNIVGKPTALLLTNRDDNSYALPQQNQRFERFLQKCRYYCFGHRRTKTYNQRYGKVGSRSY